MAFLAAEDSVIAYPRGGRGDHKQVVAVVPSNSDGVYISNYAVDSFLAPGLVLEGHADHAAAVRAFVGGHWHMNITHRPNEVMLACVHFDAEPRWQCTDATGMDFPGVDSVTMIRHHSTSPTRRVIKFPNGADALLFGRRVVEKQFVPYYQGRNPRVADSLKKALAKKWPG